MSTATTFVYVDDLKKSVPFCSILFHAGRTVGLARNSNLAYDFKGWVGITIKRKKRENKTGPS